MAEGGFLVVNPRSGDDRPSVDELLEAAHARGIATHVLQPGEDPGAAARDADAQAIGAAGGDGSLASVAAAALERDLPFVAVPFGTRNHFARDLGLDVDDPIAALDAFDGREVRVDVGRADERVFLNNVSIGLYAGLVRERERHRLRRRMLATGRALLRALRHRPRRLLIDGKPVRGRIVLAANNEYELDLFSLGRRERLDSGKLFLYVAEGLLPTAWETSAAASFRLEAKGGALAAAIDGELVTLEPPVELRIEPRALRVLVPPDPGG